jgi:hypothetical protein
VLLVSLVAAALLSACYAAYIYHLGTLLTGSPVAAAVATSDIGTQRPHRPAYLLTALGPAIVWLGVFGLAALLAGLRYLRAPSQVLAVLTVLMWCVMMYAGSRTSADGFPWRFERDAGAPLVVAGTFGFGLILASLPRAQVSRQALAWMAAAGAACLTVALVVLPAAGNLAAGVQARGHVVSRSVAAAGIWLRQHNSGGTIITTPDMNGVTNRAVLAIGDYAGLQSYFPRRIRHPRAAPPAGRQPLIDTRQVLSHPGACESARIVARDDVRYVVLSKFSHHANLTVFRADLTRYRPVFQDPSVIIYAPTRVPCQGG